MTTRRRPLSALLWLGWCCSNSRWGSGGAQARRVTPSSRRSVLDGEEWQTPPTEPAPTEPARRALAASADDHLVTELPGLDSGLYALRHWAGHVPVDGAHHGNLFYWLFEADLPVDHDAPLVVWLNGGPGCSSMDGLFLENGPFRLSPDLRVSVNEHAWTKAAWVVYLDQPVGTGLSFTRGGGYPRNDDAINKHLLTFFDGLFDVHPHLAERPLFLTGESHAGHYIPSLALAMLRRNSMTNIRHRFSLSGLAIGNGWFDPWRQYDVSAFAHATGLLSAGQAHAMKQKEKACRSKLEHGTFMSNVCWDLLDDVVRDSGAGSGKPKVVMYDVRSYSKARAAFPPNHERVERYLNDKAVREALHASSCPIVFKECTDPPYDALKHQDGKGVTHELMELLNRGVRTLFYNGQYDLICNHLNVEAALDALSWSGTAAFRHAPHAVWTANGNGGKPSGYVRTAGPLSLLLVLDSGHMVPMDRPAEALEMLTRFVHGRSLADAKQAIKPTKRRTLLAANATAWADHTVASVLAAANGGEGEGRGAGSSRWLPSWFLSAVAGVAVGLLVGVGTGARWGGTSATAQRRWAAGAAPAAAV